MQQYFYTPPVCLSLSITTYDNIPSGVGLCCEKDWFSDYRSLYLYGRVSGTSCIIIYYSYIVFYSARCGEVCSHMAAILFKIEACIRLKICSQSCTELPCVWNQAFSKNVCYTFSTETLLNVLLFRFRHLKLLMFTFSSPITKECQKKLR